VSGVEQILDGGRAGVAGGCGDEEKLIGCHGGISLLTNDVISKMEARYAE
jgi:hypothetical protein